MRRSKERGYNVSKEIRQTSNKFVRRVEKIFDNLSKPLEWLSFLNNDLPILMDICEEVQKVSIQKGLNRSQTRVNSILINDYLRILNPNGWQETHIFQAPLSSERFKANVVSAMQKKKTIGVTGRHVIISKKK